MFELERVFLRVVLVLPLLNDHRCRIQVAQKIPHTLDRISEAPQICNTKTKRLSACRKRRRRNNLVVEGRFPNTYSCTRRARLRSELLAHQSIVGSRASKE